jgi:hypothetical protein
VCQCAGVCVHIALLNQHATRMRHIWTSFVATLAPPYFWTLSHKRHVFRKKVIENKMCVLIFSTIVSKTFLIVRRNQRDIVINMKTSSCKVPVNSCRILIKLEFPRRSFRKSSKIKFNQNSSSGSRVVPCGRQRDRRMDMTKLTIVFRNFANTLRNDKPIKTASFNDNE